MNGLADDTFFVVLNKANGYKVENFLVTPVVNATAVRALSNTMCTISTNFVYDSYLFSPITENMPDRIQGLMLCGDEKQWYKVSQPLITHPTIKLVNTLIEGDYEYYIIFQFLR